MLNAHLHHPGHLHMLNIFYHIKHISLIYVTSSLETPSLRRCFCTSHEHFSKNLETSLDHSRPKSFHWLPLESVLREKHPHRSSLGLFVFLRLLTPTSDLATTSTSSFIVHLREGRGILIHNDYVIAAASVAEEWGALVIEALVCSIAMARRAAARVARLAAYFSLHDFWKKNCSVSVVTIKGWQEVDCIGTIIPQHGI